MEKEQMIAANEFCIFHNIELSFIYSLNELGLIEIIIIEGNLFLPFHQIKLLEKLMFFKNEMDINVEGLHTIEHLLQRINNMQQHILQLKNRLAFYEG